MRALGINQDSGLVYIGNMWADWSVVSDPLMSVRMFVDPLAALAGPAGQASFESPYLFQELSYDATARIRRGYIWKYDSQQPQQWRLKGENGPVSMLMTYRHQGFVSIVGGRLPDSVLLTFGSPEHFTVGELVHLEAQADGRDLLTIRMRQQFHLLPTFVDGWPERVETADTTRLHEALKKVVDGYRNSPPESIVDRSRDALTVILQIATQEQKKDLGALVKVYDRLIGDRNVVSDLAHTVARFHSRAKPSEAHRDLPAIAEREAELSVLAVGCTLVTLGWARW